MRKIALVGTASSGSGAPYDDESWEIWGVSARADYVTRADRWFELHRLFGEPEDWTNNWRAEIKKFSHDTKLYMLYPEPELGPEVIQYPYDKMVDRFGTYFMTSSFAWMMALAIDEMAPRGAFAEDCTIGIWGVEMEYGTEYRQQRAGFRHFIDLASVLGINVTRLAAGGLVYEPVPYPLWQDDPLLCKLEQRTRQTKERLERFNKSLRLTRTMIAQNRAVVDALKKVGGQEKEIERLECEIDSLLQTSSKLSRDITEQEGANEEQRWLGDYLAP
jgi:hypothetical protein